MLQIRKVQYIAISIVATSLPVSISAQSVVVLRNGNVVDVRSGEVARATVVIRDGLIEAVSPELDPPPGSDVVDASRFWIVPGLIETHTHTVDRPTLRRALSLGVTSALTIHTGTGPAS